ncbi:MAG: amidoligase family protein [Syntrophales bacterium]
MRQDLDNVSNARKYPGRFCRVCGRILEQVSSVCSCGDFEENTSTGVYNGRREIARVPSDGLLKEYIITQNPVDGALNCNCPEFEEQSDLQPGLPFGSCSHMLYLKRHLLRQAVERFNSWKDKHGGIIGPSLKQAVLMKPLGVRVHERLSTNQAHFLLADALARLGVSIHEYEAIMRRHGTVSVIPRTVFGVELECFYNSSNGGQVTLMERVRDEGIEMERQFYNHHLSRAWKLTTDASVHDHPNPDYCPQEIVSPPLYGEEGFKQIETVLRLLKEIGGGVNETCGYHIHINAGGIPDEALVRLMQVWYIIERRFIWGLISPSRREAPYRDRYGHVSTGGAFCREIRADIVRRCISNGPRSLPDYDRYHSLNYAALRRYGTVEIRSAAGTAQYEKVKNWAICMLKLTDSVWHRGRKPEDFVRCRTIEEFLDAIGMPEGMSIQPVMNARNWAIHRYRGQWHWHKNRIALQAFQRSGAELLMPFVENELRTDALRNYTRRPNRPLTAFDPQRAGHTVHNLCSRPVRGMQDEETILSGLSANRWRIASAGQGVYHTVSYDPAQDTVDCTCGAYRRNGRRFCSHAGSIARYLWHLRRAIEERFRD